jgi:hypothetical protein
MVADCAAPSWGRPVNMGFIGSPVGALLRLERTARRSGAFGLDSTELSRRHRAYLRQQAEILIAMSRATLDLGVAKRLREMASELRTRAAEQEDEPGFTVNGVASFKHPGET